MIRVNLLVLLVVSGAGAFALPPGSATQVESKTVIHDDGTRTESVKDLFKHQLTEMLYDGRKIMIAKKVFLLGANGDPTQGTIYDGAGNVVASVQFILDDLGRVIEERCTNTRGEIFQRVIRQYDQNGNALPPTVHNYKVQAPYMRSSTVNFIDGPDRGRKLGRQPAAVPGQIQSVSPGTGAVYSPETGRSASTGQPAPAKKEKEKKGSMLNPLNWFKK